MPAKRKPIEVVEEVPVPKPAATRWPNGDPIVVVERTDLPFPVLEKEPLEDDAHYLKVALDKAENFRVAAGVRLKAMLENRFGGDRDALEAWYHENVEAADAPHRAWSTVARYMGSVVRAAQLNPTASPKEVEAIAAMTIGKRTQSNAAPRARGVDTPPIQEKGVDYDPMREDRDVQEAKAGASIIEAEKTARSLDISLTATIRNAFLRLTTDGVENCLEDLAADLLPLGFKLLVERV